MDTFKVLSVVVVSIFLFSSLSEYCCWSRGNFPTLAVSLLSSLSLLLLSRLVAVYVVVVVVLAPSCRHIFLWLPPSSLFSSGGTGCLRRYNRSWRLACVVIVGGFSSASSFVFPHRPFSICRGRCVSWLFSYSLLSASCCHCCHRPRLIVGITVFFPTLTALLSLLDSLLVYASVGFVVVEASLLF